ncbi:uncharacterized protein LOC129356458 isoform X2 [Poeciliopsis prolifica]|uniref:uncharacterized protein LOC129356458 isoform X2 n=1 Tax=Poeciliopsis prolifica TaxID=188132 RepID=UPI002413D0B3|nr:uncharacterized protein LOC129356458 isoform X2 [Poeciliopsis prolifica]
MFSLWGLVAFLCLHQRTFCSVFQTSRVNVKYGDPAVLHCDGSGLKGEGLVHWELRGEDVVILREEVQVSEKFQDRVELPSEEQVREGNWSMVLRETRLKDADMYECIFGGATTISIVWLLVSEPHVDPLITAFEGTQVDLACFIRPERENIKRFYWTLNGRFLIQHDHQTLSVTTYEFPKSIQVNEEEFHLYLKPTRNDSGKYQCWYSTGESGSPKLALPESYTLTVVGITTDSGNLHSFTMAEPTDTLPPSKTEYDMEEKKKMSEEVLLEVTTAARATETPTDHLLVILEMSTQKMEESVETSSVQATRTSRQMVTLLSEQVNAAEATELEDSTHLIQDDGNLLPSDLTQQTETFEDKETFSDEDDLDASWSVFQLGDFPWVRIGIIGGVLLITAVVLCVLRALHHI